MVAEHSTSQTCPPLTCGLMKVICQHSDDQLGKDYQRHGLNAQPSRRAIRVGVKDLEEPCVECHAGGRGRVE